MDPALRRHPGEPHERPHPLDFIVATPMAIQDGLEKGGSKLLELGTTTPRRSVDPLDTSKYILAARSALEGGIFNLE